MRIAWETSATGLGPGLVGEWHRFKPFPQVSLCYTLLVSGRRYLPMRISQSGYEKLKALAEAETGGNVSEMARILLAEAIAARDQTVLHPRRRLG